MAPLINLTKNFGTALGNAASDSAISKAAAVGSGLGMIGSALSAQKYVFNTVTTDITTTTATSTTYT